MKTLLFTTIAIMTMTLIDRGNTRLTYLKMKLLYLLILKQVWNIRVAYLNAQESVYMFFLKLFGGLALPQDFNVSVFEYTKPMDYLHQTYPTLNDAQILQVREQENYDVMKRIVHGQFGKKGKVETHFKMKAYYSFDKNQELVIQIEPKSKFGNKVLVEIMNARMKNDKYTRIITEE